MKGKKLIIIDMDGTVSDNTSRERLMPRGTDVHNVDKWLKFNEACIFDGRNEIGVDMVEALIARYGDGAHYVVASALVTGRTKVPSLPGSGRHG